MPGLWQESLQEDVMLHVTAVDAKALVLFT
jgi:hypothetical protein